MVKSHDMTGEILPLQTLIPAMDSPHTFTKSLTKSPRFGINHSLGLMGD